MATPAAGKVSAGPALLQAVSATVGSGRWTHLQLSLKLRPENRVELQFTITGGGFLTNHPAIRPIITPESDLDRTGPQAVFPRIEEATSAHTRLLGRRLGEKESRQP